MLKIRRSRDCLIFNMGIPISGKNGLYIEMGPWCYKWPSSLYHPMTPTAIILCIKAKFLSFMRKNFNYFQLLKIYNQTRLTMVYSDNTSLALSGKLWVVFCQSFVENSQGFNTEFQLTWCNLGSLHHSQYPGALLTHTLFIWDYRWNQ